jgi:hypothetical protein
LRGEGISPTHCYRFYPNCSIVVVKEDAFEIISWCSRLGKMSETHRLRRGMEISADAGLPVVQIGAYIIGLTGSSGWLAAIPFLNLQTRL